MCAREKAALLAWHHGGNVILQALELAARWVLEPCGSVHAWAVECPTGIAQAACALTLRFKEKPSYAVISHNLFRAARHYMSGDFLVLI